MAKQPKPRRPRTKILDEDADLARAVRRSVARTDMTTTGGSLPRVTSRSIAKRAAPASRSVNTKRARKA